MSNKYKLIAVFAASTLVLTGCFHNDGGEGRLTGDGGIFRSDDSAQTWQQKVQVSATFGRIVQFPNAHINSLDIDPNDPLAIYAGSDEQLLYSFDGAESWQIPPEIKGRVVDVAVDHFDTCEVFIAQPQKLSRTTDCNRSFKEILPENREGVSFHSVLTDHFNPNVVYAATSEEVLKSTDNGNTWKAIGRWDRRKITSLVLDSRDSRVLYAGLDKEGIRKTSDGGASWIEIKEQFKDLKTADRIYEIVQDKSRSGAYYASSEYGLTKTTDGGISWSAVALLTPPESVEITALATDPQNGDIVYYTTDTTFYKTSDGGRNWQSSKLPSSRVGSALLVNSKDDKVIYLGVRIPPEEQQKLLF